MKWFYAYTDMATDGDQIHFCLTYFIKCLNGMQSTANEVNNCCFKSISLNEGVLFVYINPHTAYI